MAHKNDFISILTRKCLIQGEKKYRLQETLTLLMWADSSTDTKKTETNWGN